MAARDCYKVDIKCVNCGETGVIAVSENDYPFMKRLDRNVDSVEGEFVARMKTEVEVSLVCKKCGCETRWPNEKNKN